MQLSRIEVEGLFGRLNHIIPLSTTERIVLLYGTNGVGKTTILRMLRDLFAFRFLALSRHNFRKLSVIFDDGTCVNVVRGDWISDDQKKTKPKLDIRLIRDHEEMSKYEYRVGRSTGETRERLKFPIHLIDEMIPWLERVAPYQWHDQRSGESIDLDEIIFRYGDRLPGDAVGATNIPEIIKSKLESVKVTLIETQRLTHIEPSVSRARHQADQATRPTVVVYAEDLAERIQQALRESGTVSTRLDQGFAYRLLSNTGGAAITDVQIRERYSAFREESEKLKRAGLLESAPLFDLPQKPLEDKEREVMQLYLSDVNEKLRVFDKLLQQIELFERIINSSFRHKRLFFSKEKGFFCVTKEDNRSIALDSLSSGEQHEIVLTYGLIFKCVPESLILIDEPEISLHVVWQNKVLNDLLRIAALSQLSFVVATHSPAIVNGRDELSVALRD